MDKLKTNLAAYDNSWYKPGRYFISQILWYMISSAFLKSAFPFYGVKRMWLRIFGAKIGKGVIIKPHVTIKYPWNLEAGNNVWIGEQVWIDNLVKVRLKDNVCVSQGVLLLCGNHNYKKTTFDLLPREITLEEGSWAGARSMVCPGVRLGSHSLLTVGSVATNNLEAYWIYQGNPATKLKERVIRS